MEYTIQHLSRLAGVSSRSLRYYDEIGLLVPARVSANGYRIYRQKEVDLLQQILFYKELGVDLVTIKQIIHAPNFDAMQALKEHHAQLLQKRNELNQLLVNVEKTITSHIGGVTMSNKEKFEGFKREMIEKNEQQFGSEIREKYGNQTIDASNARLMGLSEQDFQHVTALEQRLKSLLARAFATGDASHELAQQAAELHKQWISYFWPTYSEEAHASLAQMYVDDERFTAHYDKEQPGTAKFLRDSIWIFTGMVESKE